VAVRKVPAVSTRKAASLPWFLKFPGLGGPESWQTVGWMRGSVLSLLLCQLGNQCGKVRKQRQES